MDALEYYKLRLEHTLQYTHQATNLIYLLNGGVLALLYFIAKLPPSLFQQYITGFAVIILSIINFIHSFLMIRQGQWYHELDIALTDKLSIKRVSPSGFPYFGTYDLYALLHAFLGLVLLIGGAILILFPGLISSITISDADLMKNLSVRGGL